MQTPTLFVFDVDGVITNIQEKKITHESILPKLDELLRRGSHIVFNTGRSVSWVEEVVLNQMKPFFVNRQEETHIFTVGEFGGTWAQYTKGELTTTVDPDLTMPDDLQESVKRMIDEEFPGLVFYDDSKLTMISVEVHARVPLAEFAKHHPILNHHMEEILAAHPRKDELKFRPGRIASDIMFKKAGKDLGARRIIEWMGSKDIRPSRILTFGDTTTDVDMAKELYGAGFPVEFIYTADPEDLKGHPAPFGIIFTKQNYELGTLEYLAQLTLD